MPLPPIERSPTLLVRFSARASERLIHLCCAQWEASGLIVLVRSHIPETNNKNKNHKNGGDTTTTTVVVVLTATQAALQAQAERLRLVKRTHDTGVMEYFCAAAAARFRQSGVSSSDNDDLDPDGLFNAQERAFLTCRILKQVTVGVMGGENDNANKKDNGQHDATTTTTTTTHALAELLQRDYQVNWRVAWTGDSSSPPPSSLHPGVPDNNNNNSSNMISDTLFHVLRRHQLLLTYTLVHQPALRDRVVAETTLAPLGQWAAPVALIQGYFGYECGFYFAWISFLTQWYFFPGVLGLLVYLFRVYRGDTIDTDEYTPFYGLVCFVWAVLFLRFWERQEKRLAYQWGTYSLSHYERQKFFERRPDFRGTWRQSPVTGEYEMFYPAARRRLAMVFSALVTMCMLAVAFIVMILSLNLQGYINPNHNPQRWGNHNPHPFHFPALAVLAEQGNTLDATTLRNFIPVVIHVLCINILNAMYRAIAKRLTILENHETQVDHSNSLVVKRFLFEAFDCYIALFYLAFYERNVDRLRAELVGVFQIDTVRRVLTECILPMVIQSFELGHFVLPKSWNSFIHRPPTMKAMLEDLEKDEYEQFDDYMEIVIQLGYVTLFASAYPLASLVAIFANWIEIRADAVKLARLCRRPDIHRSQSIGTWRHLMSIIVWLSALTNCLIAGFTSDQLQEYFPSFYITNEADYTDMGHSQGWVAVFVIFALEHLLIAIGLLIYAFIPAVPEDLEEELERRQFLRMQEHEEAVKLKAKKEE